MDLRDREAINYEISDVPGREDLFQVTILDENGALTLGQIIIEKSKFRNFLRVLSDISIDVYSEFEARLPVVSFGSSDGSRAQGTIDFSG